MSVTVDLSAVIASVEPGSMGERLDLAAGDVIISVNGIQPRDVIEWYSLVDSPHVEIEIQRDGTSRVVQGTRQVGEPFGVSVTSALFDRVHTCDNHCEFCFIYQLPKGLRRSLYLKDDDYRLSFLFGNFTTLTRFTEADLERVVDERLSPIYVSIHAAHREKRAEMLRNDRGGTSLRWLRALLDEGIEVRGQIVLCPGVNDGEVLEETLLEILENYSSLDSLAVVPLGLSKHNTESRMRVHTQKEAREAVEVIERWRNIFEGSIGRPLVHCADELYLQAHGTVPQSNQYGDFPMLEDGIGIARLFIEEFNNGERADVNAGEDGFFANADRSESANPTAYMSTNPASDTGLRRRAVTNVSIRKSTPWSRVVVLTSECAAPVVSSLVDELGAPWVQVVPVKNTFFGGNTSVAGLLVGHDLERTMSHHTNSGPDVLFLIPDVCLNGGKFLDGVELGALQSRFRLQVVGSRGHILRQCLQELAEEVSRD